MQSYAIVGASNNKEKYGYKVMLSLKELGYEVIPIHPKESEVLGEKVYKTLTDAINDDKVIDVVVLVVPPKITEDIVHEVNELGILKVHMQPGSESKDAINYLKENEIEVVYNSCIMVEKGNVKK
jgi:predicted CoA-binding protein